MNEQKPLGYATAQASNRLSNGGACEVITSARPLLPAVGSLPSKIDTEARALYLHPDPDAEKLRARIRVLEAELAEESSKAGKLQTEIDNIPLVPGVGAMPTNGILTLNLGAFKVQVPVCAFDSFQTVVTGLACAINRQTLPAPGAALDGLKERASAWEHVWDELSDLDEHRQECAMDTAVRLIRELRSAKEEQATEIVRLRATIVDIQDAARDLPKLGALLTAEKVAWAAREIRRLRAGGAAEWLDANASDGWDCLVHPGAEPSNRYRAGTGGRLYQYAPTGAEAIARLARSLGWPGTKTPPAPAETAPVAASGATDGVAEGQGGSARPGATSCRSAFVNLGGESPIVDSTRRVRGTVESAPVSFEPLPPIEPGRENEERVCEPDNCPLPADVDGWRWTTHSEETTAGLDVWGLSVVRPNGKPMSWRVYNVGRIVASSECKTLEGGKRFAVKAARRAWRIRNGGAA